ncbi:UNC-like C-terminal-domain-containing protein [Melampsora americana]|nr:UNC-like C-terminal-domain-containing protein [Melampsora americana]
MRTNDGDTHSFGRRAGFRVRAAVHELSRHAPAMHFVLLIFLSITTCGRIHLLDQRLKKAEGEIFYMRVHTRSQPCTSVSASWEGFQSKQSDTFNDPETVKIAESLHPSSILPAFLENNSHHVDDGAADDGLQDVHAEKYGLQAWPEDIIGDAEKGLQTTTQENRYQVQTGLRTSYMAREAFKQCIKDRDGPRDFAFMPTGGYVIHSLTSKSYVRSNTWRRPWSIMSHSFNTHAKTPETALRGDGKVGNCWAFRGSVGQLGIGLSSNIDITALSIEHIGAQLAQNDITSAPREFELWGVSDDKDTVAEKTPLFKGVYSISSPSSTLQMFKLDKSHKLRFSKVLFKVISNHGNPEFTCLYRVRIHGQPIF